MSPGTVKPTVITGVRAWTGLGRGPAGPATIRLEGERIAAVGTDPGLLENAELINFENMFAIPGLIDCHVHLALDPFKGVEDQARISPREREQSMQDRAEAMVRCGITTARDLGEADWAALGLRDRIAAGVAMGPRLLCAGQPLTTPGGHCHFWGGERNCGPAITALL